MAELELKVIAKTADATSLRARVALVDSHEALRAECARLRALLADVSADCAKALESLRGKS